MGPDIFHMIFLHMDGMVNKSTADPLAIFQYNIFFLKNRKFDFPLAPQYLYLIFMGTAAKIPIGRSSDPVPMHPTSGHGILGRIQPLLVTAYPEYFLHIF